jgi:hypothetical protein
MASLKKKHGIKTIARMHYGLTKKEVKDLAFKYARENNKKKCQKDIKKELSRRKPEATCLVRATAFNKTSYKFKINIH